jgi:hypothetical protein
MDWWRYLLTTQYTPFGTTNTILSLIFTLHKSPQHLLSLFQPDVFTSRSLTVASNCRDTSASRYEVPLSQQPVQNFCQLSTIAPSVLSLPWRAQLTGCPNYFFCNSFARTTETTPGFSGCMRNRGRGNVFTEPLAGNGSNIIVHLMIVA